MNETGIHLRNFCIPYPISSYQSRKSSKLYEALSWLLFTKQTSARGCSNIPDVNFLFNITLCIPNFTYIKIMRRNLKKNNSKY